MIQEATNPVYIITNIEDITTMYHTAIPEKIKECIKNGIEIKLLTETDNADFIPLIARLGLTDVRVGKLPSKGITIIENGKQLIMSGSMKESKDLNDETDSVLHTNSPAMIDNIYSLCTHLWKTSKPITILAEH